MENENLNNGLEVAVIGMSGRFPGSENIEKFWDNLKDGIEGIKFFLDEELIKSGIDKETIEEENYIKARGSLENIEYFDHSFFNYSPKEAKIMDPQLRILHESIWAALEDAGYNPKKYKGLIGSYIGANPNLYWMNKIFLNMNNYAESTEAESLNNASSFSTRIAYKLNLKGPSYTVQTACSSSLVAIHLACQGLIGGESDIAVAGGVEINLPDSSGYVYEKGMVYSKDGHCKPFDEEATGTVPGSGVGIVVLKRLSDALADRDYIYAVVKGSAINNDGSRKVSFAAPSVEGQAEVIKFAQQMAEVEAESISYVEAHGTGTELGDPIEIEGLKLAFETEKVKFCGIGSVKSNIGHLGSAAGVAGFIKTALSVKNKMLLPTINFKKLNPKINLENSPFYINSKLTKWESENILRAGVSSFGIGGTNVHVILEEPPILKDSSIGRKEKIISLSGKTELALERATENLINFLEQNKNINLNDVAYSLHIGRESFNHRRIVVGSSLEDTIRSLKTLDKKSVFENKVGYKKSIAFMFPGQGAQYINMGLEIYDNEEFFKNEMDNCFNILREQTGKDFKAMVFPEEGANQELSRIEDIQPIIFIFEYSLAKLLIYWGIEPSALIGYSSGEYAAACISGVFTLEDALKIVVKRGELLKEITRGVMLSVPLSEQELKPLLNNNLSISVVNDQSCIISGEEEFITAFENKMKANRCICMRLNNLHIGHSHQIEPIMDRFREAIKEIKLNEPKVNFISCITGKLVTKGEITDYEYWVSHLRNTVRFSEGISSLLKNDKCIILEVGPGRELSIVARRQVEIGSDNLVLNLIRNKEKNVSDEYYLLKQLGILWLNGVDVNWDRFYINEERNRIPLPTYPFDRNYFDSNILEYLNKGKSILLNSEKSNKEYIPESMGLSKKIEMNNETNNFTNHIEEIVINIVKEIFGLDDVSLDDDFFDLGGDSIKAIIFINKVREKFNVEITINEMYSNPIIKDLSYFIECNEQNDEKVLENLNIKLKNQFGERCKVVEYITEVSEVFVLYIDDADETVLEYIKNNSKRTFSIDYICEYSALNDPSEIQEISIKNLNSKLNLKKLKRREFKDIIKNQILSMERLEKSILSKEKINKYRIGCVMEANCRRAHTKEVRHMMQFNIIFKNDNLQNNINKILTTLINEQLVFRTSVCLEDGIYKFEEYNSVDEVVFDIADLSSYDYNSQLDAIKKIRSSLDKAINNENYLYSLLYNFSIVKLTLNQYCLILNIDHQISDVNTPRIVKKYLEESFKEGYQVTHFNDYLGEVLLANKEYKFNRFKNSQIFKEYREASETFYNKYPLYGIGKQIVLSDPFIVNYSLDLNTNESILETVIFIVSKMLSYEFKLKTIPIGIVNNKRIWNNHNYYYTIGNFVDKVPCTFDSSYDDKRNYYNRYLEIDNDLSKEDIKLRELNGDIAFTEYVYKMCPFSLNYLGDYTELEDAQFINGITRLTTLSYSINAYSVNSSSVKIIFANGLSNNSALYLKELMKDLKGKYEYTYHNL